MKALAGKRIVITRAAHQAGELEQLLLEREAIPLLYPCIDIQPPQDAVLLRNALQAAVNGKFDWLILTSANTVRALKRSLDVMNVQVPMNLQVAAVGSATAQAAKEILGIKASVVPERYRADDLAEALQLAKDTRVLLPQSEIAEPTLALALSNIGASVTTVVAYETVIGSGGVDLPSLLERGEVDAITFTSGSTVANLLRRLEDEGGNRDLLEEVCAACIGNRTAEVARLNHLPVTVIAAQQTLEGLVSALEHYYAALAIGESK